MGQKLIKVFFVYALLLFSSACVSKSPVVFPEPVEKPATEIVSEPEAISEPLIDYDGLQTFLGLDRPIERLGYVEKSFSTCEVGYGYSSNRNCRTHYFILIHFQLLCRNTNEDSYTEALKSQDMRPLNGRSVRWTLENMKGILSLNGSGYGKIKKTSRLSQKSKRLKLNIGNDNLYMKAGEINKVVTPANWCN